MRISFTQFVIESRRRSIEDDEATWVDPDGEVYSFPIHMHLDVAQETFGLSTKEALDAGYVCTSGEALEFTDKAGPKALGAATDWVMQIAKITHEPEIFVDWWHGSGTSKDLTNLQSWSCDVQDIKSCDNNIKKTVQRYGTRTPNVRHII